MTNATFLSRYGPWALVAGASEGLGEAYANELAKRGLDIILVARTKARLQSVHARLSDQYDVQIKYLVLDLSDIDHMMYRITGLQLDIGLIVYNAAYAPLGKFINQKSEDLQLMVRTNVLAPLMLTHLLTQGLMQRQRSGGLILMSSMAGNQGTPLLSTYAATKAFNTILAEGLCEELRGKNIDIIASIAGAISTPGFQNLGKDGEAFGTLSPEEVVSKTLAQLGRRSSVVPGVFNKVGKFLMMRCLPRSMAIKIMHQNTKSLL